MDFAEQIKKLVVLLDTNKDKVTNEEATKMALVMPFHFCPVNGLKKARNLL